MACHYEHSGGDDGGIILPVAKKQLTKTAKCDKKFGGGKMQDEIKIKSPNSNCVLVVIPDERTFDTITFDLGDHLPPNTELRCANFWHELEEEARLRHVDVLVYIPRVKDDADKIQKAMVEIFVGCREAYAIIVTPTHMGEYNEIFEHEMCLSQATAQSLATAIKTLLSQLKAAIHEK
jgi:hypothetical protein